MRRFYHLLLLLTLLIQSVTAQTQTADCNGYFAYKPATKFELIQYDKKDKPTTILRYQVLKNESSGNGTTFFFHNQTLDGNRKPLVEGDFSVVCKDGQVFADVRNVVSPMLTLSPESEVDITGDKLIYPHALTVGQRLPDAESVVKSRVNGMTLVTITLNLTNRKVEGFEKLETPAGTFDCVKISYDSDIKMTLMKRKGKSVEYLAKGIGLVKAENFDEKGKKTSSQLLTKLEK